MQRIIIAVLLTVGLFGYSQSCPCSNVSLCSPVKGNFKEVFVFLTQTNRSVWEKFDWNKLTTIALFNYIDGELTCFAHEKNVRLVNTVSFPTKHLLNDTYKREWIKEQVIFVQVNFLDGINVDYEDALEKSSPEVDALTNLVKHLKETLQVVVPGSQVTFDVPWSPYNDLGTGVDGRNYDFIGLANVTDFLFVMSYDIQSQMLYSNGSYDKECYARANSGLYDTAGGLMAYMRLGIDSRKLVFGQPWYGYDYECLSYGDFYRCIIKEVPFRGVNCSDAAGTQLCYSSIMDIINNKGGQEYYDEHARTPYVLYKDTVKNRTHQVWFDHRDSLFHKFLYVSQFSLRGVGVWNANCLDYTHSKQIKDMWGVLPNYKSYTNC